MNTTFFTLLAIMALFAIAYANPINDEVMDRYAILISVFTQFVSMPFLSFYRQNGAIGNMTVAGACAGNWTAPIDGTVGTGL